MTEPALPGVCFCTGCTALIDFRARDQEMVTFERSLVTNAEVTMPKSPRVRLGVRHLSIISAGVFCRRECLLDWLKMTVDTEAEEIADRAFEPPIRLGTQFRYDGSDQLCTVVEIGDDTVRWREGPETGTFCFNSAGRHDRGFWEKRVHLTGINQ